MVDEEANLICGSGATGARKGANSHESEADGEYVVSFAREVSGLRLRGTLAAPNYAETSPIGFIGVSLNVGEYEEGTEPESVRVLTRLPDEEFKDLPFHLAVFC